MRNYTITARGQGEYRQEPIPTPSRGQVSITPLAIGLCGSDRLIWQGQMPQVTYPRIPCHEIVGRIDAINSTVSPLRGGQIVAVDPYRHCNHCPACRKKRYNACQHNQTLGVQRDGVLREQVVVDANRCYPVPAGVDPKLFVLAEPLALALHIVERAGDVRGKNCLVVGVGNVGSLVCRVLGARGAMVYAVVKDKRADWQRAFMADAYKILGAEEATYKTLHGMGGIDIAFECAGEARAVETCIDCVEFAGRVVLVGHSKQVAGVRGSDIVFKELDILGSRNSLGQFPAAIAMIAGNPKAWGNVIQHRYGFDDTEGAFEMVSSDKARGKVVIDL